MGDGRPVSGVSPGVGKLPDGQRSIGVLPPSDGRSHVSEECYYLTKLLSAQESSRLLAIRASFA